MANPWIAKELEHGLGHAKFAEKKLSDGARWRPICACSQYAAKIAATWRPEDFSRGPKTDGRLADQAFDAFDEAIERERLANVVVNTEHFSVGLMTAAFVGRDHDHPQRNGSRAA